MGQGLGKNSPITLSLGNQPDIHCKKCGGSGDIYDYQTSFISSFRASVVDGIIELPDDNRDCEVKKIYNYKGFEYPFEKSDKYIKIDDKAVPLTKGESVDIVFTSSLIARIDKIMATRICKGFYCFTDLQEDASTIEGVYYKIKYDLISIKNLNTLTGSFIKVKNYYKNCIEIEEQDEDYQELIAYKVEYIKPLKFVVLSQNFNKETLYLVQKHNGEAVCTFPYMYDVSENDIITVLTGHMINKIVMKKVLGDDVIPEYFVENIVSLETKDKSYEEGKDFILVGTNRIHWITSEKPKQQENMSITFRYNPTYRVAQSIANLRTSENQRLPRKVILKQLSTFQESRGVNING